LDSPGLTVRWPCRPQPSESTISRTCSTSPIDLACVPRPRPLSVTSRVIRPSCSGRATVTAVAGAVGQGLAGDGQDVVCQGLVQRRAGRDGEADVDSEAELRGVL